MFPVPTSFFLTSGVGVHQELLTAFELALRDADIEQQNLVSVSSILPPHCEQIEREHGVATLRPGEITFCVMARTETNEPGRRIHSSIGLARPTDPAMYGYISEHHGYGMTPEESGDYAEDLAATIFIHTGDRLQPGCGLERTQARLSDQQPHHRQQVPDRGLRGRCRGTLDVCSGGCGLPFRRPPIGTAHCAAPIFRKARGARRPFYDMIVNSYRDLWR
jgi:arginine decarboxylase